MARRHRRCGTPAPGAGLGTHSPDGRHRPRAPRRHPLRRREPRCMACGGLLHPIPRESARPEAPPRTYAWCEEFYRCARCAKLFWRGTHWRRIEARLQDL
ncbi:MAG: hypothetical protein NTX87_15255 [Planctomycetota bacterium]|nr:hypothetical protein [Planctomycetota bacterium]